MISQKWRGAGASTKSMVDNVDVFGPFSKNLNKNGKDMVMYFAVKIWVFPAKFLLQCEIN